MTITPSALSMRHDSDPPNDTKRISEAAKQFEALLIGQMLKSAESGDGEGLAGTEDETSSALLDMGAEQFAQTLANNGGFGIAKMVVAGLESHANR